MGVLSEIFSYGNGLKRKVNNLLADPAGTIGLGVTRFGEDQNALLNLMSNAYPMAGERTVLNSPEQVSGFRKQLADKATDQAMAAATVWHGSPHKFDKFDASKIGTGEGAQAYGHGLYLAESPEVAGQYAKNIMGPTATPENIALKVINATGDESVAAMRLKQIYPKMTDAEIGGAITNAKGYQGNTYKVDLPDEHIAKMLDWDKPLSQQHPDVQAIMNKLGVQGGESSEQIAARMRSMGYSEADAIAYGAKNAYESTGQTAYRNLHETAIRSGKAEPAKIKEQQIAELMRRAGIPGIRYLDGGSRGAGQGSSNFVVFPGNEDILSIMERNGQPVLNKLLGK